MTTHFQVSMHCEHCAKAIRQALELPGVEKVEIDLAKKRVYVTHNAPATAESLRAAIEGQGYEVEIG